MAKFQVLQGGGEGLGMGLADYIWADDKGDVRHKKKTILVGKDDKGNPVPIVQRWGFSAASREGWETQILVPCFYLPDPTRPQPSYIVLCEVRNATDQCYPWNHRNTLRKEMDQLGSSSKLVWFGYKQEYTLLDIDVKQEEPSLEERRFLSSERHMGACFDAGLLIHSMRNAVNDPWDFKVGVRNFPQDIDPDPPSALIVGDHLIVARYLMQKVAAERGLRPIWGSLKVYVSTPALRESGGSSAEVTSLRTALWDRGHVMREIANPINGGCLCIRSEIPQSLTDPYRVGSWILKSVWSPKQPAHLE